jgi:hypothetical protein
VHLGSHPAALTADHRCRRLDGKLPHRLPAPLRRLRSHPGPQQRPGRTTVLTHLGLLLADVRYPQDSEASGLHRAVPAPRFMTKSHQTGARSAAGGRGQSGVGRSWVTARSVSHATSPRGEPAPGQRLGEDAMGEDRDACDDEPQSAAPRNLDEQRTVNPLMVPARYNVLYCSSRPALRAAACGGRPRAGSDTSVTRAAASPSTPRRAAAVARDGWVHLQHAPSEHTGQAQPPTHRSPRAGSSTSSRFDRRALRLGVCEQVATVSRRCVAAVV